MRPTDENRDDALIFTGVGSLFVAIAAVLLEYPMFAALFAFCATGDRDDGVPREACHPRPVPCADGSNAQEIGDGIGREPTRPKEEWSNSSLGDT
jgi:hypothetical protein